MIHQSALLSSSKLTLVGFLGVVLLLMSVGTGEKVPAPTVSVQDPPTAVYHRLGNYSASISGATVTAHTFQATPEYFALVYSVACEDCKSLPDLSVAVQDSRGNHYAARQDVQFGTEEGVRLGLLVSESYIVGGKTLSLVISDETGKLLDSLDLLENNESKPQSSFTAGGRLAPEEGVLVGSKTIYTSGAPGTRAVAMTVHEDRLEQQREYFALIESDGAARVVSESEYRSTIPQSPAALPTSSPE